MRIVLRDPATGKVHKTGKSRTKYNTLEPVWDEEVYFIEYDADILHNLEVPHSLFPAILLAEWLGLSKMMG